MGVRPWTPTVALVAHGIHDRGGMERACAELISHLHDRVRFVVVSCELTSLRAGQVDRWVRVRAPMRPIALKLPWFYAQAGAIVAKLPVNLVHTIGAIVPNRADLATVHFCQTGYVAVTGSLAPSDAPVLRRVNTSLCKVQAILAERWTYRPGRIRQLAAV
ncbi:MAG TPA: hypothetical protein VHW47_05510, partial [Acidimicrobiales bacterium]|nr:hypothetical protein [Acidimicrobiales bacterium]